MPKAENVEEIEFLELGSEPPQNPTNTDTETTTNTTTDQDDDQPKDTDKKDQTDQEDIDQTKDTDQEDGQQKAEDEKTQDELEDDGGDQDSIYKAMIESSGLDLSEEEQEQLLSAEEDTEGFTKVASTIANKKAEQRFNQMLEQHPLAAGLAEYEANGGDPEKYISTYFPEQDYTEMEVSSDDVQQQKQIVRKSLEQQGFDEEDIESQIDDFENAGILENNAKRSLKLLAKNQQKQQEQLEQEREQLREKRQQQAQEQYQKTVDLVEDNKIEGINIPENQKQEFLKYVFEPVDEQGNSQAAIDSQKLDLDKRLLITYLNFSGYQLDDLIDDQAERKSTKNIRDAINKSNNKENLKSKGSDYKEKSEDPSNIVSF